MGIQRLGIIFVCVNCSFTLARCSMVGRKENSSGADIPASKTGSLDPEILVTKDSASALPDLGYLLREATFSVDCNSRKDSTTESPHNSSTNPTAEEFYSDISQSAAGVNTFQVHRLRVLTPSRLQPGTSEWGPWYRPFFLNESAATAGPISRLVILAEYPGVDGLSATELMIRNVGPHLSFIFRLRWMPPLSKRLHRLAHLARQRAWWRVGLVPLILASLLLAQWAILGLYYLSQTDQLGNVSPLKAGQDGLSEYLYGSPVLWLVSQWSAMGPAAALALLVTFGPFLLLLAIFAYRGLRYIRGALYAATGTYLDVKSPNCYRFVASRFLVEDGEELSWGMSCCRIMEEIVTNRIIDVLQRHGIDTRSIREELGTFVNQGIYMTGGNIVAENIAVGFLARLLKKRNMKRSRLGQGSLLANPTAGAK